MRNLLWINKKENLIALCKSSAKIKKNYSVQDTDGMQTMSLFFSTNDTVST